MVCFTVFSIIDEPIPPTELFSDLLLFRIEELNLKTISLWIDLIQSNRIIKKILQKSLNCIRDQDQTLRAVYSRQRTNTFHFKKTVLDHFGLFVSFSSIWVSLNGLYLECGPLFRTEERAQIVRWQQVDPTSCTLGNIFQDLEPRKFENSDIALHITLKC